ncbi:sulfatase-like hydrolase/transferase [Terrarubrum flagellatum]|uniref:sulfatase-like hydrolase/transferase n=1 Tax=Terrirubrum flagellatum TaxID=2895980 RepID=UPI003145033A
MRSLIPSIDLRLLAERAPGVVALSAATFGVLMAPDLIFQRRGIGVHPFESRQYWPVVLLLALFLTMTEPRWLRVTVMSVIAFGQFVWFGALQFFGGVLKPEQLQLAAHQADEVAIGLEASFGLLAPAIVIVALTTLALFLTQEFLGRRFALRSRPGGVLLITLLTIYVARIFLHTDLFLMYPSAMTPSALGPIHSLGVAIRASWTQREIAPDPKKTSYVLGVGERHDGPVTIVVIMGESVNAARLSLYDFARDTTPNLKAFEISPPPGFVLLKKVGFSAGVATIASVPNFMKIPYYPVGLGMSPMSIFRIASDNGFRSFYYSAQLAHSLDIAGDAHLIEQVETAENWGDRLAQIHDDLIIDFLHETPPAQRRFFFLHQRVNHAPYIDNCDHVAATLYALKPEGPSAEDLRRNDYDNGLRCFDRSMKQIFDWASAQPGEVDVFYSSDHNELMGEQGMWGHGPTHFLLSVVPMMLFTNRGDGAIANAFREMRLPTAFDFTALIARALGTSVTVEGYDPDIFYVNAPLPFGLSGFLKVTRLADGNFRSEHFNRSGHHLETQVVRLPDEIEYKYAK